MVELHTPMRLRLLVGATLLAGALADVYAVRHHLPYQLGGHGDPAEVGRDWSGHGTALGPPLFPMLVLLAIAPFVGRRPSRVGAVAEVVGLLVAVTMAFGTVGEPSFRRVFTPSGFDAVQVLIRVVVLGVTVLLGVACAGALLRRRVSSPAVALPVRDAPGPASR